MAIDPDEIIEGMQDLDDLKNYFYDHYRLGIIFKKDYDYIFKRLDQITDYLIKESSYKTSHIDEFEEKDIKKIERAFGVKLER